MKAGMTTRPAIVIASSKPWHFIGFKKISKRLKKFKWHYVSTQKELAICIKKLSPRFVFFLHWHLKVPAEFLCACECICFHMTNVPFGRGGSPLQNLILRRKRKTVVAALRMTGELDAGPVYIKKPLVLNGRAEEIYLRAGKICWEIISWIIKKRPVPKPQRGKATKFVRRKPEQSELPKGGALRSLYDFIRMLDAPSYPLAFIKHGHFLLQFSFANYSKTKLRAFVTIRRQGKQNE